MSWRILMARMLSEAHEHAAEVKRRRRMSEAVGARLDGSVMSRSDRGDFNCREEARDPYLYPA